MKKKQEKKLCQTVIVKLVQQYLHGEQQVKVLYYIPNIDKKKNI